jgi:hypothetical protein
LVDGSGDGSFAPDGIIDDTASVRSERSGNENGRVYHIGFTATDSSGENCSSEVQVGESFRARRGGKTGNQAGPFSSVLHLCSSVLVYHCCNVWIDIHHAPFPAKRLVAIWRSGVVGGRGVVEWFRLPGAYGPLPGVT